MSDGRFAEIIPIDRMAQQAGESVFFRSRKALAGRVEQDSAFRTTIGDHLFDGIT